MKRYDKNHLMTERDGGPGYYWARDKEGYKELVRVSFEQYKGLRVYRNSARGSIGKDRVIAGNYIFIGPIEKPTEADFFIDSECATP